MFPWGAACAGLLVVITHLLVACVICAEPMPRRDLRRKVAALTRDRSPQLIVAGDSRAECGLLPGLLADRIGLGPENGINMAVPAGDLPGVLAAYREFAARFPPRAIMVISVSVVEVNDRAADELIGDETLWSVGWRQRFRLVSARRAALSLFLPERELLRRQVLDPLLIGRNEAHVVEELGYRGEDSAHAYSPLQVDRELEKLDAAWYNRAVLDGVRWRLFRGGVRELCSRGVQVVLLDSPAHPAFEQAVGQAPFAADDAYFHEELREFSREAGVPLLRFNSADICADAECIADPASSFVSLLHLNRRGAQRLSARVGDALAELIERDVLQLPAAPHSGNR